MFIMKLDIKIVQQNENHDCQVATMKMVTEFNDDNVSYEELEELLASYKLETGMHSQGPATVFLKLGYKVFFAHHDLELLQPEIESLTESNLKALEEFVEGLEEGSYQKAKLLLDIGFINFGGKYSTELPSLEDIDHHLSEGRPAVLSGVRNKGLHLDPSKGNGSHSILIIGKEGDNYLVNDPSPNSQGQYQISPKRLLHAWYN